MSDVLALDAILHHLIRLADCLSANDNLATLALAIMSQLSCEHLLLCTHKLAHGHLNLTNRIEIGAAISIDHCKLVVLNLFKEVGQSEGCLEVRIERVHNLLSLADLDPVVVALLIQDASRV